MSGAGERAVYKGFTPTPSESRTADALQAGQLLGNHGTKLSKMVPPPRGGSRPEASQDSRPWEQQLPHHAPRRAAHESERSPGGKARLDLVKEESGMSAKTVQAGEISDGDHHSHHGSDEAPHTWRTSQTPSTIGLHDVTGGSRSTINGKQKSKQRHIIFHCATPPNPASQGGGAPHGVAQTVVPGHLVPENGIMLTVRYRDDQVLLRKRNVLKQKGEEEDDPSLVFERPADVWAKMQEELKRVYCLGEAQQAIFTFKVDKDLGLDKEDGGKRVVIVNQCQFLHLLKKARPNTDAWCDPDFFEGQPGKDSVTFRYQISLPHSVYLPPSFKSSQVEYPPPTADEVRQFCFRTGGMRQGSGIDQSKAVDGEMAFGLINFDAASGDRRQLAHYALVQDRRRVHRYQTPITNPHLLRFLLEDVWKLYQPGLVIEIAGSPQGQVLNKAQWAALIKAVMGAAKSMGGWVVTGGTDAGVMKLMGEGRTKYAPEVPLIGIASWAAIHQQNVLAYAEDRKEKDKEEQRVTYRVVDYNRHSKPGSKRGGDMVNLNPDHSHFILVDDSRPPGEDLYGQEINLRADLMSVLTDFNWREKHGNGTFIYDEMQQKLHSEQLTWSGMWHRDSKRADRTKKICESLPAVTVVIRGGAGTGTFRTISESVDSGIPLVLVKGSGGAADLMVDLWNELYGEHDEYKTKEKLPAWARAKQTVRQALKDEYGTIENAYRHMDQDLNGVLDVRELKRKFETILMGGDSGRTPPQQQPPATGSQAGSSGGQQMPAVKSAGGGGGGAPREMDFGGYGKTTSMYNAPTTPHAASVLRKEAAVRDVNDKIDNMVKRLQVACEIQAWDDESGRRDWNPALEAIEAIMDEAAPVLAEREALAHVREETFMHPEFLAWQLINHIRGSVSVATEELLTRESSEGRRDGGDAAEFHETGRKGFGLSYTDFVQCLDLDDFQEEVESNVHKSDKIKDLWKRHGLSGEKAPPSKIDADFNENRAFIINALKKKENISIYNANSRHDSLQSCMCRAICNRLRHPMEIKEKVLLCVEWGMVGEARDILERQAGLMEGSPDDSWLHMEAINKGLSRAIKADKVEFVKLFLEYGADIELYNLNLEPAMHDKDGTAAGKKHGKANAHGNKKRLHTMDKQVKSRFKKLFGLAKKHVQDIRHIATLVEEKLNQGDSSGRAPASAGAAGTSTKVSKKLKRYSLDQIESVIRDLLGRDFKGGIGQFGGPYNDLLIWAVMMNRHQLALFFWEKCKSPMKMALTVVLLYKRLAASPAAMGRDDLKDSFMTNAEEFERLAVRLQDSVTKEDTDKSLCALERRWIDWVNEEGVYMTNLDIAVMAKCSNFMDKKNNFICFRALQQRWSGDLRYTGWMGLSPEVWSVLMFPPMLFITWPLLFSDRFGKSMLEDAPPNGMEMRRLPAQRRGKESIEHPLWSKFVNESHKKSERGGIKARFVRFLERTSLLFSAPCSKFVHNSILYAIYVFTLSFQVILEPPRTTYIPPLELAVLAWSSAYLAGQLYRIFKITAHDGLVVSTNGGVLHYFKDWWNTVRMLTSTSYIVSAIVQGFSPRTAWQIQCISFLLAYVGFLQKFGVSRSLGPLLVMISKMFGDIASFVIIWAIILVGFSGSIHLAVMAQGFGDFWLDEQAPAGMFPMVILMVYTMTMNLLLVNLLIATMSTTYSQVLEHSEVEWMYQKYDTTREYMDISSLPIPFLFLFWIMSNGTRFLHSLVSGRWSEHEESRNRMKKQAMELFQQADEPLESLIERCRDVIVRDSASGQQKNNEQMLVQSMGGVYDRLAELEARVTKHGEHTSKVMSSLRNMEEDASNKTPESVAAVEDRTGHL